MKIYFLLICTFCGVSGIWAQTDPMTSPSPTPQPIRETVIVPADLPQPIDEVSKTVNTITGQEMRERADFSLVETLRSMPGFRVQQLGGFGRTANIKTRGLRNQDTAILIDGFRLRDTAAITGDVSPFLSDITLTSVSRIEVLRGSGSSLYGTNSIGGTVNFITPDPQPGTNGQVSYAVGGLGLQRFRGNLSHGTKGGKFGFNLAGSRTFYTKGIDGNDDARNTNFQSRINARPNENTAFSVRFFVSDAFVKLNSGPDTLGTMPPTNSTIINAVPNVNFRPDVDDPDNSQESQFLNAQFTMSHAFTNELSLNAGYSGLRTERENVNGPLGVGFQSASTSVFSGTINTANASLNWTPVTHNLRIGYEYERESYGNDGVTPSGAGNFFTRAGQSSNTFFLQELYGALDGRLQLAGGVRAQFFNIDQPTFSLTNAPYAGVTVSDPPSAVTFDGAVSYFFRTSGTKLRAHVGNGYRVPSLYERYGTFFSTFPSANFVALGDPRLKPEKSIAADIGIEQYAMGEKVEITGVFFQTKLIDVIGYGNVVPNIGNTPRPFGGYENQKGGTAKGGEFSVTFRPVRSTDLFASYTLTKSRQRTPQVSGSGVLKTLGIPEHQFTIVATQRFGRAWVNFDLLVTSSYIAPIFSNSTFTTYLYRFDGNRRGDLTGGYTFRLKSQRYGLRVFGTIENVFDNEYYENGFRTAGVNGRVGLAFSF
ncbi:MAG: TonB-dependent receptor [Acidobacteria bacterium]|nr:TonB-dependent receptor [Acidobacteriota bacterium]